MNSCERYQKAREKAIARNRAKRDSVVQHEGSELRRILETLAPEREKAAQQDKK